jgi:hypothetical protein
MPLVSVRYKFTQRFGVTVDEAFAWSIDYDPKDFATMGVKGKRKIKQLSDDAIILEDTVDKGKGPVTKTRLVRINHERRSFSNTHIGGPTPHSQFWYEFFPELGGGSRLEFTGLFLLPSRKKMSEAEVARVAEAEREADAKTWVTLAKAMEADLRK